MRWQRLQTRVRDWSILKQLAGEDPQSTAAQSAHSRTLRPRLADADRVGTSICPYCAVGCAQLVYARGNQVLHIEGDPRSPINQGTLCPKGAATFGWMVNPQRLTTVQYRAPYAEHWEERPLAWAMERIAHLVKQTRDETFVPQLPDGTVVNHTMALAELGGATLDNEENYLIEAWS
jgi:formate dehydrogenase major subunit